MLEATLEMMAMCKNQEIDAGTTGNHYGDVLFFFLQNSRQ